MPIANTVKLGHNVQIHHESLVNLYGCEIGDESRIAAFVEVQKDARIGRCCKVACHSVICTGVTIEDEVFIGQGVIFTNDKHPHATTEQGKIQDASDWEVLPSLVKKGASIGSGAVILGGITIGEGAMVGAGAVVTRDVPPGALV